jgi:hypothetical protein
MQHDKLLTLPSSLWGLLGDFAGRAPVRVKHARERRERIRERMLAELLAVPAAGYGPLATSIRGAADIDALWYQRTSLMQALCREHGEAAAGEVMAEITDLFNGLLPRGMIASGRPGRLAGMAVAS